MAKNHETLRGLTIKFRAKRQESVYVWRGDDLVECEGWRIPAIKETHVVTPRNKWSPRNILHFGGRDKDALESWQKTSLAAIGLDNRHVTTQDADENPNVTVVPIGNGFMADVTITFPA